MFGISFSEFIIILVIMVIFLHPRDIPSVINFVAKIFAYIQDFIYNTRMKMNYIKSGIENDVVFLNDTFHDNIEQLKLEIPDEPDFFDLNDDTDLSKKIPKIEIPKSGKTKKSISKSVSKKTKN